MKRPAALILALALAACGGDPAAVRAEGETTTPTGALDVGGHATAAGFLSCLEGKAAIVSAHRGGPAPGYPENAVETFERTLAQVPALIETDVRATRDGVLVLLHDETVDRTTDGEGRIDAMTLAEAKALRLLDREGTLTAFRIPTLDEALEAMRGRTVLQLDVKRGVDAGQVVRAVKAADAEGHAAIITYDDDGAAAAADASPGVTVIAGAGSLADLDRLARAGVAEDRLVVWTGIVDAPEAALWDALGRRDIPASGGAIGRLDRRAARGAEGVYLALEEAGLDVIATDRPVAAAREIGTGEVYEAAAACGA